jgi:hypothetical protein
MIGIFGSHRSTVFKDKEQALQDEFAADLSQGCDFELKLLTAIVTRHVPNKSAYGREIHRIAPTLLRSMQQLTLYRNILEHCMVGCNDQVNLAPQEQPVDVKTLSEFSDLLLGESKQLLQTVVAQCQRHRQSPQADCSSCAAAAPLESAKRLFDHFQSLKSRADSIKLKVFSAVKVADVVHPLDFDAEPGYRLPLDRNQLNHMQGDKREEELERVVSQLRVPGPGARALVHGDSGIGKSMLVEASLLRLRQQPEAERVPYEFSARCSSVSGEFVASFTWRYRCF